MTSESERWQELAALERQERELSARRRRLHDQIDALRGGIGTGSSTRLEHLLEQERQVSEQRRDTHLQVDRLRITLGLETGPPQRPRLFD